MRKTQPLSNRAQLTLVFIGSLAFACGLQWGSGAEQAGLDGEPDEAAHYVSGIMVSEYLRNFPDADPLGFAEDYYLHYPKISIGHFPPLFYLVEGVWMLFLGTSKGVILLLLATLAAGTCRCPNFMAHRERVIVDALPVPEDEVIEGEVIEVTDES